MNERVVMRYQFINEETGEVEKDVKLRLSEGMLKTCDLCEMFVDFMTSAGYAEENIYEYFKV